jgi:Raf kinase inhibitor-like YbhB/YbcL family protein
MRRRNMLRTALAALALMTAGTTLAESPKATHGDRPMSMTLRSAAFEVDAGIPARYTCDGADVSPPLSWSGVPKEAASLALIVDDPDAPDPAAPKMTWVHWVLYNLPPQTDHLSEAVGEEELPRGTAQGLNDWKRTGFGGPCPPIGRHRYFFKLYALDTRLSNLSTPTKAALESAMEGHVIAEAHLVGTYQRHK